MQFNRLSRWLNLYRPLVVFLIETKRNNHEMEWLRSRWRYDKCFTVKGVGRGEGLALLWMKEVNIKVMSFSKYHIDVKVGVEDNGNAWRFTGFYRDLVTSKRPEAWAML